MKKIIYVVIALFFLGIKSTCTFAQSKVIEQQNISSKLLAVQETQITEKAYLQFDKPYYAVGDTIYYKAYLTLGAAHKLSALSGILYVDIIGPNNKLLSQQKLLIKAGTSHGDFALADTLRGGTYRIRAYTNWMRNKGDESFFEQNIQVGAVPVNGTVSKTTALAKSGLKQAAKPQQKPLVQFMPEGGSLINGNFSKIAFKAVALNGLGISLSGFITDDDMTKITDFKSNHLGMGSFMIVPKDGKNYKANIVFADGTTALVPLPKATNNGYTININNMQADTLRIRISAGAENSLKHLSLVAQAAGELLYASENQSDARFFSAVLPKKRFPTGVVQFTLFSATGEPMNERLVFIDNHDGLKLTAKPELQTYQPRQKVKIELNVRDKDNEPVTGSFSVAVTDENKVQLDTLYGESILSSLLLTSDLKGTVEQPGYYFTNQDMNKLADLDNLLLTQGYRYFQWKDVLNNKPVNTQFAVEKGIKISGMVKRGNKPAQSAKITLFSKDGGAFFLDTLTDINGRFAFNDLIFPDSTKFVVQSKLVKGQDNATVSIDSLMPPAITIKYTSGDVVHDKAPLNRYLNGEGQFLQNQQLYGIVKKPIVLKEVTVKGRAKKVLIPNSQNLNGPGNADQVITAKDLEKFTCGRIADCLAGMITGVIFRNGVPINVRQHSAMAIVVDGFFLESDVLDNLDQADIEGIEVIVGPNYATVYGGRMANGGLIITTKRAKKGDDHYRYAPGVVTYMPKGFYKAREFYSPQYNSKNNTNIPDLRSTIFWQPDVITDQDGRASFSYFNADAKGIYHIVIEGIGANGSLGRQVMTYQVK